MRAACIRYAGVVVITCTDDHRVARNTDALTESVPGPDIGHMELQTSLRLVSLNVEFEV